MKYLTLLLVVITFATPATIVVIFLYRLKRARSSVNPKLVGASGTVCEALNPLGAVLIEGELWPARSSQGDTISVDQQILVVGIDHACLLVKLADS